MAAGGKDPVGVGLCLGGTSAVMAVVRDSPMRVVAVAEVTWPEELWRPDPPPPVAMSVGRRVLVQARRRLGLPRWCPVAVVVGPSICLHGSPAVVPDWLPPRGAELLVRAALAQGWVIVPDHAATLGATTGLEIAAELAAAMAGADAGLAVGAAIAALSRVPDSAGPRTESTRAAGVAASQRPGPAISKERVAKDDLIEAVGRFAAHASPEPSADRLPRVPELGWAVERIGRPAAAPLDGGLDHAAGPRSRR